MVYPALLPPMCTPQLPVVDWTDAPANLNGLVHFAKRWNLVSARVLSHFKCSLLTFQRKLLCCTYNEVRSFTYTMEAAQSSKSVPINHTTCHHKLWNIYLQRNQDGHSWIKGHEQEPHNAKLKFNLLGYCVLYTNINPKKWILPSSTMWN